MTTFSQMIDSMVAETKRPDMRSEFASWLNQTIRECHFEPERGNVVFLRPNYREERVVADADDAYSWPIPNVATWQGVAAVRFDNVWDRGRQTFAQEVYAGRAAGLVTHAYQVAGDRIFFKGYGGLNAALSLAWYEYPPALKYYSADARPASYDLADGWTYHADFDVDDETRTDARIRTSNWLLMRWSMVLEEGLRAKVYKRLSDETRQRTSYSLYSQQRQGLITSERADLGGAW